MRHIGFFFTHPNSRRPRESGGPPDFAVCQAAAAMRPCIYILASGRHGTLYVGVTSDLARRIWEHKNDVVEGFTSRYAVHILVYAEFHATMIDAITREKQIKKWRRAWKIELIEKGNPEWRDLYDEICDAKRPFVDPRFRGGDEN
jgi:putative endonuclease